MLAFPAPYYCLISILITTQSQPDYSHHAATVRQVGGGGNSTPVCTSTVHANHFPFPPVSMCLLFALHWFAVMSAIVFESGYLSGSAAVTLTLCVCLNRSGPRPTT